MAGTGTAKYRAVQDELLRRITEMSIGDRLPSEPDLCDQYGVSRITLRKAVDGLVLDGWLAREHGRGTFVTEPSVPDRYPEQFADAVTGFHRQQTGVGNVVTTRVLRQELIPADVRAGTLLGLDPGASVVELVRLRFVNDQLHHHVITHVPYDRFADVYTDDFTDQSLYTMLRDRYDVELVRNDLTVRVEAAPPEVALNLGVAPGLRLLTIDSLVYDRDGAPVAVGTARHAPDNSEIRLNLSAHPAP